VLAEDSLDLPLEAGPDIPERFLRRRHAQPECLACLGQGQHPGLEVSFMLTQIGVFQPGFGVVVGQEAHPAPPAGFGGRQIQSVPADLGLQPIERPLMWQGDLTPAVAEKIGGMRRGRLLCRSAGRSIGSEVLDRDPSADAPGLAASRVSAAGRLAAGG
jgi:hypothetical protein